MPWKNGGGITHEILKEDGPDGFILRLSVAEVAQDGPFSHFPNIDRHILLLQGAGFVLDSPTRPRQSFNVPGQIFAFAGEEDWFCRLLQGPVRDMNVMCDRRFYGAEVDLFSCNAQTLPPAYRSFILAISGQPKIHADGETCILPAGHLLEHQGPAQCQGEGQVVAIRILKLSQSPQ